MGMQRASTASASHDEAGVIAKVSDVSKWEQLSEVRVGGTIGGKLSDGTWLVTGRVPISRIENVRKQSFESGIGLMKTLNIRKTVMVLKRRNVVNVSPLRGTERIL